MAHGETKPSLKPDYNLAVCMLASGSKGNAVYVSDGTTSILLDAGLSGVQIEQRMRSKGLRPEDLNAILVSHEHSDHIRGVGVISRRYNLPVYINPGTKQAAASQLGKIKEVRHFECGATFLIQSLRVHPFALSHDAEDPSGFTIQQNGTKIGIATDLGIATAMVKEHLKACNLMILEANHDPEMLVNGPYPWPLKQRIKSRTGHLANEDTRRLLKELHHDGLRHVILAHLSETNNHPRLAFNVVGEALNNTRTRLSVATQDVCGDLLKLR